MLRRAHTKEFLNVQACLPAVHRDTRGQQVVERGKWVTIKARGAGRAAAAQSDAPGRSLSAYLALPVEEYSLLDPDWVERCGCLGRTT